MFHACGVGLGSMLQRAPMSPELARQIGRSISDSLLHADAFNTPSGYVPAGAFRRDVEAVNAAPVRARDVRGNLLATMTEAVGMFQESTVWMCHLLDPSVGTDLRRSVPSMPPTCRCITGSSSPN